MWDFLEIKASKRYDKVVSDLDAFPGTQWFVGAELNFAENLLRYKDKETALIFKCETKPSIRITYEELHEMVGRLSLALREQGVKRGDRVVGYMPNMIETVVAMLAATSIGAVWASCGSELGVQAVIDRFGQIEPKVLFAADGYLYKNKPFPMLPDLKTVVEAVPSIEKVIIVSYINERPDVSQVPKAVLYSEFCPAPETASSCSSTCRPTIRSISCSLPARRENQNAWSRVPAEYLLNQMKELIIHCGFEERGHDRLYDRAELDDVELARARPRRRVARRAL